MTNLSSDFGLDTLYGSNAEMQLLETIVAANDATIDFTTLDWSAYPEFLVRATNITPGTDAANPYLRISEGGSFISSASSYEYHNSYFHSTSEGYTGTGGSTQILLGNIALGTNAGENSYDWIRIVGGAAGTRTAILHAALRENSSGNLYVCQSGGRRLSTLETDGIRFLTDTGTVATGTFKLFGLK